MCGHDAKRKRQSVGLDEASMEKTCANGWSSPMATIRNRDGEVLVRFPIWPVIGFLSFAVWWLPNPLLLAVGVIGIALVTGLQIDFAGDTDKAKRKPKNDETYYEV